MKKTALLCLNGEPAPLPLLNCLVEQTDLLIAADGAANWLAQAGHQPELIIGDLDSVDPAHRAPVLRLSSQENTDAEKALDWLSIQGWEQVYLAGALGGRADFSCYNLSLPLKFPQLRLTFFHQLEQIELAPTELTWQEQVGAPVSLLPLGGPVSGVTTTGLKWNLANQTLSLEGLQSQSNQAVSKVVHLSHQDGHLLVFRPHHLV